MQLYPEAKPSNKYFSRYLSFIVVFVSLCAQRRRPIICSPAKTEFVRFLRRELIQPKFLLRGTLVKKEGLDFPVFSAIMVCCERLGPNSRRQIWDEEVFVDCGICFVLLGGFGG